MNGWQRIFKIMARRTWRRQQGFTFIEILVVVAILGVLASIAVPSVVGFMESGKSESKATEMSNLQTAVTAMMQAAEQPQLNKNYKAVDTAKEVSKVSAGSESLSDFIMGTPYPLQQPYDIDQNGEVSVSTTGKPPKEKPLPVTPTDKPIIPILP